MEIACCEKSSYHFQIVQALLFYLLVEYISVTPLQNAAVYSSVSTA